MGEGEDEDEDEDEDGKEDVEESSKRLRGDMDTAPEEVPSVFKLQTSDAGVKLPRTMAVAVVNASGAVLPASVSTYTGRALKTVIDGLKQVHVMSLYSEDGMLVSTARVPVNMKDADSVAWAFASAGLQVQGMDIRLLLPSHTHTRQLQVPKGVYFCILDAGN